MDIIWLFLPGILGLGIITSIEDIKTGLIRNKWVLSGIVYAFIMNTGLIIFYWGSLSHQYLLEILTNLLFAIIMGFGLWYAGIWTAGDGKLFIAFAALIPLSSYSYGHINWAPSLMLLMNIFIIGLIFSLSVILRHLSIPRLVSTTKKMLKEFPKRLLESVLYLFSLYWVLNLALSAIGIPSSAFLKIIIAFILFPLIPRGKIFIYVLLLISIARIFLDKDVYNSQFLIGFIINVIIWKSFMFMLKEGLTDLAYEQFCTDIDIRHLKPGMVLQQDIVKENGKFKRIPKPLFSKKSMIDEEPEGLTSAQINILKKTGLKRVRVSRTTPFAPIMTVGAIATILANGNILILLSFVL